MKPRLARLGVGALGVMLALGVSACGGKDSGGGEETLRLGAPLGLTGAIADQATRMKEGYDLYLDEHDHKLGGVPVKVLLEDTKSDASVVVQKTRKLIQNDDVHAIVGGALAFESLAIADQVKAAKMAYVSPISSADDLTQRKALPIVARTNMTSSQLNMPFGEYAYKELGYRKVALISQDYSYGWESAGGFQYAFERAGGEVVKKVWVPLEASDWSPFVRQLPRDVDAVYALPVGAGVPRLVKAYEEFGFRDKIPLIGGPDLADDDALAALGKSAVGIVHVHSYNKENEATKGFAETFRSEFGADPSYWGESTYTELMWIDAAITSYRDRTDASVADTIEWIRKKPEEFIAELRAVSLPDAPRGPVSLDDLNNAVLNGYVVEVTAGPDGGPVGKTIATFEKATQFWTVPQEEFLKQPVFSRDFPK